MMEEADLDIDLIMYKRDDKNQKTAMVVGMYIRESGEILVGWSTPSESKGRNGRFDRYKALMIACGRMTKIGDRARGNTEFLKCATGVEYVHGFGVNSHVRNLVARAVDRLRAVAERANQTRETVENLD
jgi:hypothetical protein